MICFSALRMKQKQILRYVQDDPPFPLIKIAHPLRMTQFIDLELLTRTLRPVT